MPLRNTLRPVKKLRAAPIPKWETMATVNEAQIAARPVSNRKGATGMNAPTAVAIQVIQASRMGVLVASPIFSSSRTCSSSALAGSRITWAAMVSACVAGMPLAW
jgi:hypothetical protein